MDRVWPHCVKPKIVAYRIYATSTLKFRKVV